MTRETVLEQFGIPISEWGNCEAMADEVIRLRNHLGEANERVHGLERTLSSQIVIGNQMQDQLIRCDDYIAALEAKCVQLGLQVYGAQKEDA